MMATEEEPKGWFDWAYKGVDHKYPGNGGPECRDFLSVSQRCWESVIASLVGLVVLLLAYSRLQLPAPNPAQYRSKQEPLGKRFLLLLMCLTFGIELGFKLATRRMIWIGNPCHVATMMQIFILAAPPSRIVTAAFRLHMHMLTGAPIAILFPVINTRLLPFETGVYFLQHVLMLIIPFYLMKTGDPFIPEKLSDFTWAMTSFGILFIYHFLPLQYLAYLTQVNLNNMLCPAVSDPFHGKYYRLFAIGHQIILIPTLGKVFVLLAQAFHLLPSDNKPDDTPAAKAIRDEWANKCTESGSCTQLNCEKDTNNAKLESSEVPPSEINSDNQGDLNKCAQDTVQATVQDTVQGTVQDTVQDYVQDSVQRTAPATPTEASGNSMITKRIVNGKIMTTKEAKKIAGSKAAQGSPPPKESSKPLTVYDLQARSNGHIKTK